MVILKLMTAINSGLCVPLSEKPSASASNKTSEVYIVGTKSYAEMHQARVKSKRAADAEDARRQVVAHCHSYCREIQGWDLPHRVKKKHYDHAYSERDRRLAEIDSMEKNL